MLPRFARTARTGAGLFVRNSMLTKLATFMRDESGQDLIEYALLASFMGFAALAGVNALSAAMKTFYETGDTVGQNSILVEVQDPQ
jgi:Flp pilus assembly pilin Flp